MVLGTGLAITYQSGLFAEILDFSWSGIERGVIDGTHFASTNAREYTPTTLYDPGEITVEMLFDPETNPTTAISAVAETVTVTYADPAPASTMAASGFMTAFEITAPLEDRMTATATIKLTGAITHG